MSSSNMQDFDGSESEDEDFNPAPAVDSDNEEPDLESQAEENRTGTEQARASRKEVDKEDEGDDEADNTLARGTEARQLNGDAEPEDGGDDGSSALGQANGENRASGRDGGDVDDEAEEEEDAEAGNDEDEDEDEEEEEDEDEEDEVQGHRRKRHKRDPRLQFIDEEAEVEDEDEELDEEDDDLPGEPFIAETHPDDLLDLPAGGAEDDRRHRDLDRQRELAASMDAEKQAAALREKYGRNRAANVDSVVVPQRLLLPSVHDPTIWGVRCKNGKEKEVVFSIMKRFEDRLNTREPIAITSAFERGGTMAGFIYVEAQKQGDVRAAVEGIPFVYLGKSMVLVPVPEMPDLLRTRKSKSLTPGNYVRIKRGKYAGDLALVEDVVPNGLDVTVKIVPRLDYGLNEDSNAPGDAAKRKRLGGLGVKVPSARPPQRLFSEVEAKKKHAKFLSVGHGLGAKEFTYLNDTYVDGFLIKDVKIHHLETDVNPTLEEVTKFTAGGEDGTDTLDLAALAATLKANKSNEAYLPGDMVEIYQGEQQGVCGRATAVHGDIVTLKVTEGQLKGQTVETPMKGLRKLFREGDHVKVIGGSKYHEEVGMVTKVKDDRVTIISDSNNQEITVFSKDLREATDASGGPGISKFDLYDLVQLDASTVACVIRVDRESLRVLDQNGSVRSLLPSNVSNRLERRRHAVTTDRDGSEIRNDDTVKEYGGEQRQGRVLHIHRNFLFIQNRQQSENAGVFVVRNTNVTSVVAKGGRVNNAGPDLTKMNPARNGTSNTSSAMAPPKSMGRDRLIGKTVTVRKGPYKGLLGIVKDTTDTSARVELHTKNVTITIGKETLTVKDAITGNTVDHGKYGTGRGQRTPVARTPYSATPSRVPEGWQGSRTPMAAAAGGRTPAWGMQQGSRTPGWQGAAHGGKTPAWNLSSRTPAWSGADGSRTVNPYADGGRTAYGGSSGSSTWSANARTPYSSNGGYGDSYSGSKTPAYSGGGSSSFGAGGRTPAYNSSASTSWNSHPTPSANPSWTSNTTNAGATPSAQYDAPTPGFTAPTPGQSGPHDHPTPRNYGGGGGGPGPYGAYSTPAAAPTPGGFPETPAPFTPAGVEDDDPRYD